MGPSLRRQPTPGSAAYNAPSQGTNLLGVSRVGREYGVHMGITEKKTESTGIIIGYIWEFGREYGNISSKGFTGNIFLFFPTKHQ